MGHLHLLLNEMGLDEMGLDEMGIKLKYMHEKACRIRVYHIKSWDSAVGKVCNM